MANPTNNNSDFNSVSLLSFIYKWRKHLLIIGASAAIISAIASFLITPKYKSSAIIFPTLANTVSRSLMEDFNGTQRDYLQLGEEEQVEQTLQILKSDEIVDRIADKYNLMKHYDLNPEKPLSRTYLKEEFETAVKFKATEYMSIRIDVTDHNPDTASMIANDIIAFLDTVKNRMTKERAKEALKITEREFKSVIKEIGLLEDSMEFFRKMGLYDHDAQLGAYAKGYARAVAGGNANAAKQLEDKMKMFELYGGKFLSLKEQLWMARDRYKVVKINYEQAIVDTRDFLPFKFVVNKAVPAEKKSSPVRWLIVVVSTISALAMAIVVIIGMNNFSKINLNQ